MECIKQGELIEAFCGAVWVLGTCAAFFGVCHYQENLYERLVKTPELTRRQILTDEPAILDAIKDPDAYAIYYDLLHTTRPELWERLEEQHQLGKGILPTDRSSRTSSRDQARHVAGRFARFILAAPSDPDLKTHSTRKQTHDQSTRAVPSTPQTWMNPMAAAYFIGVQDDETWRTRPKREEKKKDKEYGKTKIHLFGSTPNQHNMSKSSALIGTTAANSMVRTAAPAEHRHSAMSVPFSNVTASPRHSLATAASAESMWPEGDSQGNWWDVKVPRPKDGGKPRKRRMQWLNANYTEAMLFSR
jgi:hypothetical protein